MRINHDLSDEELGTAFSGQFDLFDRGALAKRLTKLLTELDEGMILLLDGRWGAGKTTFVKQWIAHLTADNVPSIYFDAFESDYSESPFEALAGSFISRAKELRREETGTYKRFLSRASVVGRSIGAVSVKLGVKAATLGLVGSDEIEHLGEIGSALADGLGDISEKIVADILESHSQKKSQFEELRRCIGEMPSLLRPDASQEGSDRLIVFIDELDRCRPDFALGILETLKHFFRVPNVCFVIVANREYLELSVNHKYGAGLAAREYLEKFYDFSVPLALEYTPHNEGNVRSFVARINDRVFERSTRDTRHVKQAILTFSIGFELSLRQIIRLARTVSFAFLSVTDRQFCPNIVLVFLCHLKISDPYLYMKAKTGTLKWEEVKIFLEQGRFEGSSVEYAFGQIRFFLSSDEEAASEKQRGYAEALWNYNLERSAVVPYLANRMIDFFDIGVSSRLD